jgi:hypothetical protein
MDRGPPTPPAKISDNSLAASPNRACPPGFDPLSRLWRRCEVHARVRGAATSPHRLIVEGPPLQPSSESPASEFWGEVQPPASLSVASFAATIARWLSSRWGRRMLRSMTNLRASSKSPVKSPIGALYQRAPTGGGLLVWANCCRLAGFRPLAFITWLSPAPLPTPSNQTVQGHVCDILGRSRCTLGSAERC